MIEFQDTINITKAQELFQKMVCACGPKCFKKMFSQAIGLHPLDEFYPVVMHAELSAAVIMAAKAQEENHSFDFGTYLEEYFNLRPRQLVNLSVQTVAAIMDKAVTEVEDMLQRLEFTIEHGRIANHTDLSHRKSHLMPYTDKIRKA